MSNQFSKINVVGLAKEGESPENPGGLEKRVAMIPSDIKDLVDKGLEVFVEQGAGTGIGFSDDEYITAGATIQNTDEIYQNKDMLIKFKGPSLANVSKMNEGTILFCMAHFRSFQDRADLLEKSKINVVAMEEIVESPKYIPDEIIISKQFVAEVLDSPKINCEESYIAFLGYHSTMMGGIRRSGNRNAQTLTLFQADVQKDELENFGETAIYFYDSRVLKNLSLIDELKALSCQVFDLKEFEDVRGEAALREYRAEHPPFEFGGRKIQCLHETGMAGARYGLKLLNEGSKKSTEINVSVLGYGNVGMGAIRECYDQGVRTVQILGFSHTQADTISDFLESSSLIINGAEQAVALRGVNYLIKSEYIGTLIKKGSVVIDLVGGSASNRSAVEDVIECTYLTNPHFERNGVQFSALWGWPMMGLMKESAVKYSGQILQILTDEDNLLKGLDHLTPGVKRALVCGPF